MFGVPIWGPSFFFPRVGSAWALELGLVPWSFGPVDPALSPWCSGPLILWSPGPLVPWSSGPLVLWSLGPLVFGCGSCGAFKKEGANANDNICVLRNATKTVNDSILTLRKARKLQIPMSAVLEKLRMFAEQGMLRMS